MGAVATTQWNADRAADRCAVACAGHSPQSSLLRVDTEERPRSVSRIPLVLRDQRAIAAFSESAISARLQHGAAVVVLAVPFVVVVSLERVSPRDRETVLQADRSRGARTVNGALLDRIYSGFLHILDDAGVLLHAVLPGAVAAAGIGDGCRKRVDQVGKTRPGCHCSNGSVNHDGHRVCRAQSAHARGHRVGTSAPSLCLYFVARTHARPDVRFVRIPAIAAVCGGYRFSAGCGWQFAVDGDAGIPGDRRYDGGVFSCGAVGAGGIRSLPVVAAAGECLPRSTAWEIDHRSSLLHILVGDFLHRPGPVALEREVQ